MDWFEALADPKMWVGLLTLTVLEVVLGIDNIVFISILSGRLPEAKQAFARRLGLAFAMVMRIALLLCLSWLMGLTAPLFTVLEQEISGRDLILIAGGLFLLAKSTHEIHARIEHEDESRGPSRPPSFASFLVQVVLIDAVFSLDSVITAVGMVDEIGVMIAAIVIAVLLMMLASEWVSGFIARHPTVKMLALGFLLLIGVMLIADGLDQHMPRGYVYFAMGFSVFIEVLNQKASKHLHKKRSKQGG